MVPIGVDVHKRQCNVVEFKNRKLKVFEPIENRREDWLELLAELPPEAESAVTLTRDRSSGSP